jgi:hypothetical protein
MVSGELRGIVSSATGWICIEIKIERKMMLRGRIL